MGVLGVIETPTPRQSIHVRISANTQSPYKLYMGCIEKKMTPFLSQNKKEFKKFESILSSKKISSWKKKEQKLFSFLFVKGQNGVPKITHRPSFQIFVIFPKIFIDTCANRGTSAVKNLFALRRLSKEFFL